GRIVLLVDRPPAPHAGKGQLGAGQLVDGIAAGAQLLHHRRDYAGVMGSLADLGVLIQQAIGDKCHLARPLGHGALLLATVWRPSIYQPQPVAPRAAPAATGCIRARGSRPRMASCASSLPTPIATRRAGFQAVRAARSSDVRSTRISAVSGSLLTTARN